MGRPLWGALDPGPAARLSEKRPWRADPPPTSCETDQKGRSMIVQATK